MLNANSIPKPAKKVFQKIEVNLASLYEIMALGRPHNMKFPS
jgi:hypothetical protein